MVRPVCLVLLVVWIVSIKSLFQEIKTCRDFRRDLTYFRKAHIGFVFQNFNLISHQSVLENVKMPLYVKNMTDKDGRDCGKELSRLGIESRKMLSFLVGKKQRAIAVP